jgi:hypothetical protein
MRIKCLISELFNKLLLSLNMKQSVAFLALLLPLSLFAQKLTLARGNDVLRIEKTMTEDFAVNLCRENAKLKALESVYGTAVSQSNTMFTNNENASGKTSSDILFYSVSNTLVNGEWIKTTEEKGPVFFDKDGYRWVKIEIEGEVREITRIPFSPDTYTSSCPAPSCSTEVFNNGQSFFLHFIAPKNGFVSIFLDDGEYVQRILPYSGNENEDSYSVKGDKEYVFFAKSSEHKNVDEIELVTSHKLEQNRLFILYSTKEFEKPILLDDKRKDKNGYTFPKKMESRKYQEWLQLLRITNKSIELKIIDITIKNKP